MTIVCRLNQVGTLWLPVQTLLRITAKMRISVKRCKGVVLFLVICVSLSQLTSITMVVTVTMAQEISTTDHKSMVIPQKLVVMPAPITLSSPSRTVVGVVVT
jgi:hypothetical protein